MTRHFSRATASFKDVHCPCFSNILICTWSEYCAAQALPASPRSYAHDLSICTRPHTKHELKSITQRAHKITAEFVQQSGMQLNENKCITFGDKCVSALLPQIDSHKTQFRLVGASIKLDKKPAWTQLERDRKEKWQSTIHNSGKRPVGWFSKVKIIQSTMGKLTFGQGTHTLHMGKDDKRSLTASIIRCLLNQHLYDSSPAIIFTILSPPTVDPDFPYILQLFRSYAECVPRDAVMPAGHC